ncbi:MAG: hypothetical protein KDA85_11250, partial [Planctomycetaceae bacterium]|nr:hypothetical protein [Planctomycetaceae bacterium]
LPDGDSVVIRINKSDRALRIASNPQAFFVTDHYVKHPMMIVRLSVVDDEDLYVLLEEARNHAVG